MSKSHRDQRRHRRKVAGTAKGLREHQQRDVRRDRIPPNWQCPDCRHWVYVTEAVHLESGHLAIGTPPGKEEQ